MPKASKTETKDSAPAQQQPLRMEAYYYSFTPTGCRPVDLIISAVASAGKGYHHTEDWSDGGVVAPIQDAANEAARLIADWNRHAARAAAATLEEWRASPDMIEEVSANILALAPEQRTSLELAAHNMLAALKVAALWSDADWVGHEIVTGAIAEAEVWLPKRSRSPEVLSRNGPGKAAREPDPRGEADPSNPRP